MLEIYKHHDGEHWEHIDLEACRDCFIYAVNGEVPEPLDPKSKRMNREGGWWSADQVNENWKGYHLQSHPHQISLESHFSWGKCEVCNRQLGGDRHHIIAMKQLSPGEALLRLSTQPEGVENESELETN